MFDITEKLDAFLSAPLKETIFDYFASFLPYFANQLSPLFTFISVIFSPPNLPTIPEIIAILSSGVSFNRLMRPYMIGAAVIAALTFVLSNYAIPPTNVKRIAYTNKYVKNRAVTTGIDIQMMAAPRNCRLYRTLREFQQDGVPFLDGQIQRQATRLATYGSDGHLRQHPSVSLDAARLHDP